MKLAGSGPAFPLVAGSHVTCSQASPDCLIKSFPIKGPHAPAFQSAQEVFGSARHLEHATGDLHDGRPTPQDIWPLFYFGPFTYRHALSWAHQWPLDARPNRVFTLVLFYYCLKLPLTLGDSVVGVFNRRTDVVFVGVLRDWAQKLSAQFARKKSFEPN